MKLEGGRDQTLQKCVLSHECIYEKRYMAVMRGKLRVRNKEMGKFPSLWKKSVQEKPRSSSAQGGRTPRPSARCAAPGRPRLPLPQCAHL